MQSIAFPCHVDIWPYALVLVISKQMNVIFDDLKAYICAEKFDCKNNQHSDNKYLTVSFCKGN